MITDPVLCPECKREVPEGAYSCPHCGHPLYQGNVVQSGSGSRLGKRGIGIALLVVGIILAFMSYKTRYDSEYDYYESMIDVYKDGIREYKSLKREMENEAYSFSPGYFRNAYLDIADGYQDLIDDAEDSIEEYKDMQQEIVTKATTLLVFALGSLAVGVVLMVKSG